MMGNNQPDCIGCICFVVNPQDLSTGQCRRFPPVMHLVPVKTLQGQGMQATPLFPAVQRGMSCFEFRPRQVPLDS